MQKIWLYLVRAYLKMGLFFYFKEIHVVNIERVPKDKPLLILCNHQNALLDALLIATKCRRFSYFLTRAAVFKKPYVSKLLYSLRMLPVYRIRDGWKTIANNNAIFSGCSELLKGGQAVTIFPEGSHHVNRTVRPFSKGFTRIVFDALEKYPDMDLQLIPVGLNFVKAEAFPDSVSIHFGEPLIAKDFISDSKTNNVKNLKSKLHFEISKLTTHISPANYSEDLRALERFNMNFLYPQEVNNCIANNFCDYKGKQKPKKQGARLFQKGILILNFLLPYLIWRFFVKPKIDEIEFISTFRFAMAIILGPLYVLILIFVLATLFSVKAALVYAIYILVTTLITTKL